MERDSRMADAIRICPLEPEDAGKLTACFERCYGDSYVADFFYDAAAIRARLADGRLHSVVAMTDAGEIVGHMALTRHHPRSRTVEAGNTIVDPRCRGAGLAARLGAALFEACRDRGYVGFHHYPTTAHAIMQKLAVQGGGIETGVMLSYIPEGTDYRDLGGKSEQGRLAVVVVYQPIAAAPAREVFLPARFETMLLAIYDRARLERRGASAASSLPPHATRLESSGDARRGLQRVAVERVGRDVESRIVEVVRGGGAEIAQVDLPLSDPATPLAAEALRAHDFFFCALLPELGDGDVLRLQRLRDPEEPRVLPDLVHAEARAILDTALADRRAAARDPRPSASIRGGSSAPE